MYSLLEAGARTHGAGSLAASYYSQPAQGKVGVEGHPMQANWSTSGYVCARVALQS